MPRIQFTTKDEYTIKCPDDKKVAKMSLKDPQPVKPDDFSLFHAVTGDYVLVDISTLQNQQRGQKQYIFRMADALILAQDWSAYEEDMNVEDLKTADADFLLFYQRIDTSTAACKTKQDNRAAPLKKGKQDVPEPPKKKRRR